MGRSRRPEYMINGWIVTQAPNSFAETHAWYAEADDIDGYRIAKHGFNTLAEAETFANANQPPKKRKELRK